MASQDSQGVQRVFTKLLASIDSGNYYEAYQMYSTIYFRYLEKKKYSELLDLLYSGSDRLLQLEQFASGADLAILYIDVLTKSTTEPSQVFFEKITKLFSLMSPKSPERETFSQNALKWSIKGTTYKIGHPDLHKKIAQVFWKEKNYCMARQHFLHSKDGSGCAAMLVELHEQKGYSNEVDLFIAQAVLQYLCLHNKVTAQEVFDSYTSQHPKIKKGPPYLFPLLNFLFFLFKTIEKGRLSLFVVLCERYSYSLDRDPCYRIYLNKIAHIFFPSSMPTPPQSQGLFGTILQSFFNDIDEEDSNEDEQRNTASTSYATQDLD